ncbi:MAG TPA: hypothetical protein VMI31_09225, partial [Fimbriimonadaceae bacterium]|nr:hypothetical protein [Fimbriimonadaceae bacterium]
MDISPTDIRLSHRLAAELPGESADTLGLPPIADLTLKTDVEGIVGAPNFRLRAEWFRNGQKQVPQRIGAILQTSAGLRRLPLWLMDAVEVAETFSPGGTDVEHWGALARFRQALDPGTRVEGPDLAARVSMTDFLSGLNVRLADRLSISVNAHGNDFEVIPFDARSLCEDAEGRGFSEGDGELAGRDLQTFQHRVRERGALPAYRLSPGSYLVVERSAIPALAVMADMQHASRAEREAFIRNPRARIAEAVEAALRKEGRLDDLSPEAEEEAIESAAGPLFIETREFSERVTAITAFERPDLGAFTPCGTTWLPEQFAPQIAKSLSRRSTEELLALRGDVQDAIESGEATIPLDELSLPARPEMIATINHHLEQRSDRAGSGGKPESETF